MHKEAKMTTALPADANPTKNLALIFVEEGWNFRVMDFELI
jgi:hypothetical protein